MPGEIDMPALNEIGYYASQISGFYVIYAR